MAFYRKACPISEMCRVLEATRQGFCQREARPPSGHAKQDGAPTHRMEDIWEASRHAYGSPRICHAPRREGVHASKRRAERLMREDSMSGISRGSAKRPDSEERRASRKGSPEDQAERGFEAEGPNEPWLAGITYAKTCQGWLYLAVAMDIWSRKIVGWAMGPHITAGLVDDALKMAMERRRPHKGCIHRTGHGSQHASLLIGKTMRDHGIVPSMGSVSSPWDSAPTESLMGTIKSECVQAKTHKARDQAALEIFECIECLCSRLRLHSALGCMSPDEFEEKSWPQPSTE
ncbi:MAG: IS3 family transposase [Atopobiaceae bacterium]|nr:IS3 family transposase [Atopobiaceae bacterium]